MKKIELQLAMDGAATRTLDQAMEIIDRVAPYLDIIEIGTSFVLRYGMEPVSRVKAAHPDKKILADMKVMESLLNTEGFQWEANQNGSAAIS